MILRFLSLWLALSLALLVNAEDPKHRITSFENLPARLFFFDDSKNAVYHDPVVGDVFVSTDEGRGWKLAEGVPKGSALMVIEHPFDNRYAFVLTKGTTHYRTEDRGVTWRPFTVPLAPSLITKPLSFHSYKEKYGYIMYQGTKCERFGWNSVCRDQTWYTTDAFSSEPNLLLEDTTRCQFAHSSADFKHEADENLIYCVGFDTSSKTGSHDLSSSRVFSSTDFFEKNNEVVDLGMGKSSNGVIAFAIVSKFAVVALKDLKPGSAGDMLLFVTEDTKTWAKAQFPHASSAKLRENAYTIVESTKHSLAIDVVLHDQSTIGTLFVSNSNGTLFVESLKDTNRNEAGFVDYEMIYGVEGVGLANTVENAEEVEGRGAPKKLKTVITFDDGSSWSRLAAPSKDVDGKDIGCNTSDLENCSLHLHSVTTPHNFGRIFSSPAPGFVMGVGSVGQFLKPYDDSDTFLSTDAGVSWKMIRRDAHKYEFGDSGSVLVVINDEEGVDTLYYSLDEGNNWKSYDFGVKLRARVLLTVPDSTSQKFMLLGQVARKDQKSGLKRNVMISLDFSPTRTRQCGESDFEKWYARTAKGKECLMGHKQWYNRRKPGSDCYVGNQFTDPVEHEENCECTEEDYECDYNYVRDDDKCVPVGPEPVPAGVCTGGEGQKYLGSSGFRKIPGNTCAGGVKMDEPVSKDCSQAKPAEGAVVHYTFQFPAVLQQHAYFQDSTTILVRLSDHSIWQSSNEGFSWEQKMKGHHFLFFYHHPYSHDRAYLITNTRTVFYTVDTGKHWDSFEAPSFPPSHFRVQVMNFHPITDNLIWTGEAGCESNSDNCHVEAHYSRNNGQKWTHIESYVRNCAWARDNELAVDPTQILCESYHDKKGDQRSFGSSNSLELISGTNYFKNKKKLFDNVVGFTRFSEYLLVAELNPQRQALSLQVSLNGDTFAAGMFPPSMHPDTHAYTILESSTDSVFLHMTMSEPPYPFWGSILKSNSNGTYFGLSIDYVNRNDYGYVDFEKVIGLDGIALINVVANPRDASLSGRKAIQSRITHNDGGTWKPMTPPLKDSLGREYECKDTKCSLNIHGYTERTDPRATYSSPSVVGLLMAVGNVGEELAAYTESDTFMSRDAGFTWEEVHKDAHLWEFGDSGSILVMANDEEPVDHVLFSTDEGLNWREYKFTTDKMRVRSIVTVPADTSRRFILFGNYPRATATIAVQIDFSSLTSRQCVLSIENSGSDDFELWSPAEARSEQCLFGKRTLYHRRLRTADCVVGNQKKLDDKIVKYCACEKVDFECEFNYVKNDKDECVLVAGTSPLDNDDTCRNGEDFWYERTAYRKVPISQCVDGNRLDRGPEHICPGFKAHGASFWWFVVILPFAFTGLVGYRYYRRSGIAKGTIRLPDGSARFGGGSQGNIIDTIASVPWFLVGLAGIAWERTVSWVESWNNNSFNRRGYRNLPIDEDAQILRFEDED